MAYGFTIEYDVTDEMIQELARQTLPQPPQSPIAHPLFLLIAALSGVTWYLCYQQDLPWWVQVVPLIPLGLVTVIYALLALAWIVQSFAMRIWTWKIAKGFSGLAHSHIKWTFTEDGFTSISAALTRETAWTQLAALERTADYWLLKLRDGPQLVLPAKRLWPELEALLLRKAEAVGVWPKPPQVNAPPP